jgi:hypothetical protein
VVNAVLVRIRVVAAVVLLAGIAAAVAWWANRRTTPRQEGISVASVRQATTGLIFFAGAVLLLPGG